MLDHQRINELLNLVRANLAELERAQKYSLEELESDKLHLEGVKHLLQVSIEALLDVGAHFISHLKLPTPHSYREIIEILVTAGYLPREREQRYVEMARFRNRIVHFYDVIDPQTLYAILHNELDDLRILAADLLQITERLS